LRHQEIQSEQLLIQQATETMHYHQPTLRQRQTQQFRQIHHQ
jgi:hypothetical protein